MDLSLLRIAGLLAGLLIWILIFWRLRSHSEQRSDVWLLAVTATGLVLLSLAPSIADLPSELFQLGDIKGGRLISLLILAMGGSWLVIVLLWNKFTALKVQHDALARQSVASESLLQYGKRLPRDAVLLVIPAYNEAQNLRQVLPKIPNRVAGRPLCVAVIDDGSSDDTGNVARSLKALVATHPINSGGGSALRTGFELAKKAQVAIVVTMDGDGQHDPADVEGLVLPIVEDRADFVIGSRVLGSTEHYSTVRLVGLRVFNRLINVLMGTSITDCASGFRAVRVSAISHLKLQQDQYHTAEMIIEAAKKRLRIDEQPIRIAHRLSGTSKKGGNLFYGFRFLVTILVVWWR